MQRLTVMAQSIVIVCVHCHDSLLSEVECLEWRLVYSYGEDESTWIYIAMCGMGGDCCDMLTSVERVGASPVVPFHGGAYVSRAHISMRGVKVESRRDPTHRPIRKVRRGNSDHSLDSCA